MKPKAKRRKVVFISRLLLVFIVFFVLGIAVQIGLAAPFDRSSTQSSISAPETPTFSDVPASHPYFEYIEALYAAGLAAGCSTSPLKFCPATPMDRAQMAVFTLRGEFGVGYEPPVVLAHRFSDNWAQGPWAEKWAEGMYNASLTAGCTTSGPLKYCPWQQTPREQAAVFALRLKYGNDYTPPPATGTVFADMTNTSYYATKWAEKAYADGLIPACGMSGGKPMFCPTGLVDRGLGAHIVAKAKNLVTSPAPLGIQGHWKFDEGSWAGDCLTADIIDSSGNNRNGTACINGDAPFPVPGKFGNAGRFDGINQYANMGPGFNFTSSFTAALWIALDDYDWCGPDSTSQHIIGTHHLATPTGNGRGWGIYWDCDGLAWELTNSTGSAIVSYGYIQPSPFPVNGSWHHIALVYDSTIPSATLYWDGVPVYSESGIANVPGFLFNNDEPLTVNGLPYAPGAGAPGKIDDTRVYNRVLFPEEITSIYEGIQ